MASPAEAYILLGLRLGRHVDGLVDAYYGPEELSRQVEAEPVAEPAALVEDGDALLAGLDDGWLRDQALGLKTCAGVLAGEALSYSDEVERCFGVRPQRVDTDVYAVAHERLDELLPGASRSPNATSSGGRAQRRAGSPRAGTSGRSRRAPRQDGRAGRAAGR